MPSYHLCSSCVVGVHGECFGTEDACSCLACNYPTDEELADAPSTGEQLTAPDDE